MRRKAGSEGYVTDHCLEKDGNTRLESVASRGPRGASESISVFIVSYNTCGLLERCLKSIFENKGDVGVEVFVSDNNSKDGTAEMLGAKFPGVHLSCYTENVGFTRAVNALMPMAKGEYLLLLHPDVILLPDTLSQLLEFFGSRDGAGIVGGNLYYPDGTPNGCEILFPGFKNDLLCFVVRLLRKVPGGNRVLGDYNPLEWSHELTARVNWVWNACMMVRKEVVEKIGLFDEKFFVWYADWDFCKRATDVGWSVYYVHSAKAIHYERQSFTDAWVPTQEVRYKIDGWNSAPMMIRDRYVFVRKHCGRMSLLGVKAVDLAQNVLRLGLMAGRVLFGRAAVEQASYPMRACLNSIQAVLRS
jgi:N-acetylglucosaminyl-diphospho-decaprenol L-rhamnosyltransferase